MTKWTPAEARLCRFLAAECPRYQHLNGGPRKAAGYGFAFALTMLAAIILELESLWLSTSLTLCTLACATMITARCAGRGPAWLSVALSIPVIFWYIPPLDSFAVEIAYIPRVIGNIGISVGVVWLWPPSGFGDLRYLISSIQRRTIASIVPQKNSSSSDIGRLSVASRSTTTS